MALFSFTLDSFTIFETRSVHEDTDFATLSLGVNTPPPSASPAVKKSIGTSTMVCMRSGSCSRTLP
jgi:hypothetical protein